MTVEALQAGRARKGPQNGPPGAGASQRRGVDTIYSMQKQLFIDKQHKMVLHLFNHFQLCPPGHCAFDHVGTQVGVVDYHFSCKHSVGPSGKLHGIVHLVHCSSIEFRVVAALVVVVAEVELGVVAAEVALAVVLTLVLLLRGLPRGFPALCVLHESYAGTAPAPDVLVAEVELGVAALVVVVAEGELGVGAALHVLAVVAAVKLGVVAAVVVAVVVVAEV